MVGVGQIEASPQWQTALFLLAGGYILWSAIRGWRQGLMRQVMGIFALFAAGFLVLQFTGRLEDLLRSHVPSLVLMPVSAVLIWIVSFNSIVLIGQLLFSPTRDCESSLSQLVSGFGGAAIGAGCSLLLVFCALTGVKIVGRIAENQVEIQQLRNENSGVFWVNPQIIEMERDPEIVSDLQRGDILAVFTNRKVAALLNDPELRRIFAQGDLDAAFRSASNSRDR
jgi:Colicin V production protein